MCQLDFVVGKADCWARAQSMDTQRLHDALEILRSHKAKAEQEGSQDRAEILRELRTLVFNGGRGARPACQTGRKHGLTPMIGCTMTSLGHSSRR